MTYNLYLDDIRTPKQNGWVIVRSYQEAVDYVTKHGLPFMVSFDHDLAEDAFIYDNAKTGYDFAKWLCNYIQENNLDMNNFYFDVHSMNPVGAENIRQYMANFHRNYRKVNDTQS